MQKIDKTRSLTPGDDRSRAWKAISLYTGASLSDLVIFDIETTGLSANVSSLYLIGALWYDTQKKEMKMCQWFADDYTSECTILEAFSSFVSGFSTIVHYNGSGFDIPYLEKKYRFHHLENPFAALRSFDIYREVRKEKALFDSSSLKLSVVEKLVGFLRADNYSGKECIQIYRNLCSRKYSAVRRQRKKRKNFSSTMPMICVEHYLVPCCSIINFRCIFLTKLGIQIPSASRAGHRKMFRSPVDGKRRILYYLLKKTGLVSPFPVPRGAIVIFMKITKTIFICRKKIPPFIKASESMWKRNFANRQKLRTAI